MKRYQRFFLVFLSSLILFGLSSFPVLADVASDLEIRLYSTLFDRSSYFLGETYWYVDDSAHDVSFTLRDLTIEGDQPYLQTSFRIQPLSPGYIFSSPETNFSINLGQYYSQYTLYNSDTNEQIDHKFNSSDVRSFRCQVLYLDGTYSKFFPLKYSVNGNDEFILTFDSTNHDVDLTKSVRAFYLHLQFNIQQPVSTGSDFSFFARFSASPFFLELYEIDNTASLINRVIDGITHLPNNVADAISDVFIPDQDVLYADFLRLKTAMDAQWGALDEVHQLSEEILSSLTSRDPDPYIRFPGIDITLAGGRFVVDPVDVKVIPDGFEILAIASRTITSIVALVALFHGLRRRADSLFGH